MTPGTDRRKKALTDQVILELEKRLSAAKAKTAATFLKLYFRRVPIDDLAAEAPSSLAAIAIRQLEFLGKRAPGEALVRVFNPDIDSDGWESPHTIVEMINDDMPFLVDTAALTLSEMGLAVHLIIHPVIRVGRDARGRSDRHLFEEDQQGQA